MPTQLVTFTQRQATSIALDITDLNALDEQIIAALYTRLVVYKARIHR